MTCALVMNNNSLHRQHKQVVGFAAILFGTRDNLYFVICK